MSDSITIRLTGLESLVARLRGADQRLLNNLRPDLQSLAQDMKEEAQNRAGRRTGRLAAAIQAQVQQIGQTRMAILLYVAGVPYARIQEAGGRIPARTIFPRAGTALAFPWLAVGAASGENAFFAHVNWPGATVPAKHYILNTLKARRAEFLRVCQSALDRTLRET